MKLWITDKFMTVINAIKIKVTKSPETMILINGNRIVTTYLYDDEHEEYIEREMSIIDFINAYTFEGVSEFDKIESEVIK